MKPLKAAAVLAGSMVAVGAAAPAFAADMTPSSLNGAVNTLTSQSVLDAAPLDTNALDTEKDGSLLNAVQGAADGVNESGPAAGPAGGLLGGLPVGK
ncbi:hypothetical protein [Streptomyces sp. NPDC058045]|uniref:hypothetical protein n=1 Tax=Streptomyces sp. NPDC058045 TaxID=3346311 RepID=UPI0036EFFA5F